MLGEDGGSLVCSESARPGAWCGPVKGSRVDLPETGPPAGPPGGCNPAEEEEEEE